MQVDSKDEKKAKIKNKSQKSNKIPKNEEETNFDKNKSIDINSKSSKKTNIKNTLESNIEDVNLSNLWIFIDNSQQILK